MHVSTSGECASSSDFKHEVYPFRVAPDGWKGECFMIWQFVGSVLWKVLKAVAWLVLATLRCVLELAKLALLVFGLVARVFLIFARAAVD